MKQLALRHLRLASINSSRLLESEMNEQDISIAHRLPKKKPGHRELIVRFSIRITKINILQNKINLAKALETKDVKIYEDLMAQLLRFFNMMKADHRIESVRTKEGNIFFTWKNNKRMQKISNLFDGGHLLIYYFNNVWSWFSQQLFSTNSHTSNGLKKINSVLIPEYKLCRVLHFIIRSLKCHYDEFLPFLSCLKLKPTVLALTDTWLNDLDHIDSMPFAGLSKLITKNRRTRGGSIGLFVSECASTVIEDSAGEAMETLKVSITYENLKFGILIIYRPPNSKAAKFVEEFDSLMESVAGGNWDWIVLGDFNIDILQSSALSKSYLNVISSHKFQQVIQNPTRLELPKILLPCSITSQRISIPHKNFRKNRVLYNISVFVDLVVNSKKHPTSFEYRKLSHIEKNRNRF